MMMSGLKSWISCTCFSVCPPRHRDHGAAQPLGAVVRAEAAGEQAVAVGDVHDVAGAAAGGADRARHQVGPGVDVVLRVAHDRRLAGGARRRVDARHLLARHREHAERVVVAQVLLDGERELRQVGERLQVAGMHALGVERLAVVRHVVVGVLQRPLQALQLQRLRARRGWRVSIGSRSPGAGCLTGIAVSSVVEARSRPPACP